MTIKEELGGRYYDELATNCEGCGWLKHGAYLDGTPYLSCGWFGTIMKKKSNVACKVPRTPSYVKEYLENNSKKDNDRKRNRQRILRK